MILFCEWVVEEDVAIRGQDKSASPIEYGK
jgi:hypothetical protein